MTWRAIARHDRRRTRGSRSVRILLGLLAFAILGAAYVYPITAEEPITTARFTGYVVGWLTTLVPPVGVLLGYDAVVSDRESGALRLSLSLPHGRDDLVLGTLASRGGLLTATILAAMAGAGFLVVYPFGQLELVRSLAFVALTVLFGAIWTGIGVAVSIAVATKQRALLLGFGLLGLLAFAWGTLFDLLEAGLDAAGLIDGSRPAALAFVRSLEPGRAFERITAGFLDPAGSVDAAWYLNEWVALVVFACWVVGPLGLAYRRFAGGDLA